MVEALFVDTGYILAYINANDQHHDEAMQLEQYFVGHPLVATDAVLLEVGNALSRGLKTQAVEIIRHFQEAEDVTLIHINPLLFKDTFVHRAELPRPRINALKQMPMNRRQRT